MALKIRLRRLGKKKRPFYRMVATDSRMPRDGRFLETLGHYNPVEKPATVNVFEDRLTYWLDQGAEMSPTVKRLMAHVGFTKKYEMIKAGQDVSEVIISNQITERPKKRKKTKGDKTEAVAAGTGEAKAKETKSKEAKAEEAKPKEAKAEEAKPEETMPEKTPEKTDEATEEKTE